MGYTPLHMAAQDGAVGACRTLLEAGASVDLKNAQGSTPLWEALLSPYEMAR